MATSDLHKLWEENGNIRDRARMNKALCEWPAPHLVGAATKQAFSLNKVILEKTALWWCTQHQIPQSVPINLIRIEAGLHCHV